MKRILGNKKLAGSIKGFKVDYLTQDIYGLNLSATRIKMALDFNNGTAIYGKQGIHFGTDKFFALENSGFLPVSIQINCTGANTMY